MSVNEIPTSFWYSISFAIITFTIGFVTISFRSGDLTLKFKDLQIRTSNTEELEMNLTLQNKGLEARTQTINEKEKEIAKLERALSTKVAELTKAKNQLQHLTEKLASLESPAGANKHELVKIVDAASSSLALVESSLQKNSLSAANISRTKIRLDELDLLQEQQRAELQMRQEVIDSKLIKSLGETTPEKTERLMRKKMDSVR